MTIDGEASPQYRMEVLIMKKILVLALALILALSCCAALADGIKVGLLLAKELHE